MKLLYSLILLSCIFLSTTCIFGQKFDQRVLALKGRCYIDTNGNALYDEGEPGFPGVPISLGNSTDYKGNTYPDSVSDGYGLFLYDGLKQRTLYEFVFKNPPGYIFETYEKTLACPPGIPCVTPTVPSDGLAADLLVANTYAYNIPLIKKEGVPAGNSILTVRINVDLGIIKETQPPTEPPTPSPTPSPTPPPITGAAVSGLLFSDNNGNGIIDGKETWSQGVTLGLYKYQDRTRAHDNFGNEVPLQVTDANGRYTFENVEDGIYCLKFEGGSNYFNPGCIGQIVINSKSGAGVPSLPSDGVKSPTIIRTGSLSCFPLGGTGSKGIIYNDKDFNGAYSPADAGIAGVVVKIYLPVYNFLFDTVTSDANGQWSFKGLPAGFPVRIEFVLPNDFVSTGSNLVNFVTAGQSIDLNLGLAPKSQAGGANFGSNNPKSFITTCFVKGSYNGKYKDEPTVVEISPDAQGKAYQQKSADYMKVLATHSDVGSVHGIAFNPSTGDKFVSSYHKTNSDFGPAGSCAIYKLNNGIITVHANFNDLLGKSYCGGYNHFFDIRELTTAGPLVGKASLGQMSYYNNRLYVTNLAKNEILVVPTDVKPNATNIQVIPVPNPGCSSESDWHIFPITLFQGEIYTGGVCSGEKGSRLATYILKYNRPTATFSTVLFYTLNYPRGCRYLDTFANCVSSVWQKWQNNDSPQAMLATILFDESGHLVMAYKDRSGDINAVVSAPDLLLACLGVDGRFYLESGGKCGSLVGVSANQKSLSGTLYGPGNGNFFDNHKTNLHDYTNAFGVAKAGRNMLITTGFDYYEAFEGSIRWYNSTNGAQLKGYSLYITSLNGRTPSPTFGKQNGLGDITSTYDSTPPQFRVGRVWLDSNFNGIQDAGEPGLANIPVSLVFGGQGTPMSQTSTDINGFYKFEVDYNTKYQCVIRIGDLPAGYSITSKNADPSHPYINNDAEKYENIYISSFSSSEFGGYYFTGTNFGFTK